MAGRDNPRPFNTFKNIEHFMKVNNKFTFHSCQGCSQMLLLRQPVRGDIFHTEVTVYHTVGLGPFRPVPEDGRPGFTQTHTLAPIGPFPFAGVENSEYYKFA